jgi:hypothetical protein
MPIRSTHFLVPAACIAALSLASVPCMGQDSQALQGGITENVNLAPLDSSLAPGNRFDKNIAENLIDTSKSRGSWHMVPAWYTGQRSTDQMTVTFSRDEKSHQEDRSTQRENRHSVMTVDTYKDKTGQTWEYDAQGFWIEGQSDDALHFNWVSSRSSTVTTNSECDHVIRGVGFHVDRQTQMIKSCDRSVSQITAVPVSSTTIKSKTLQKLYDWQGHPTRTVETVCNYKRTGDGPADKSGLTRDGKPIYPLFVQFLRDHNMADRIPDAPRSVPESVTP